MRSDMFKVIVEKERWGSSMKSDTKMSRKYMKGFRPKRSKFKEDAEEWEESGKMSHLPQKVTGKKPQGWDCKQLSENLSPLKKFFLSRVGQKWDDVWSEVCENINSNSTVQKHVLDHAISYVTTDCYFDGEGKVWHNDKYSGPELVSPVEYSYKYDTGLYVEPGTGILKKATIIHKSKKEEPKPIERVDVGHNKQLHKIDGIWYMVNLKEIPRYSLITDYAGTGHYEINNYGLIRDVVLNKTVYWLTQHKNVMWDTYGYPWKYQSDLTTTMTVFKMNQGLVYAACKKQLNKKDLKKYKLK